MNCMKCGREIPPEEVFCPDCLADTANYPVKPGVVVQIPTRPAASAVKKPAKRSLSPEEQVKTLTKRVRRLWGALILSILLMAAAVGLAIYSLQGEELQFIPGQNYSSSPSGLATGPQ